MALSAKDWATECARQQLRIQTLEELRYRVYMRLQCADVPRDPWHEEVSTMLDRGDEHGKT